MGAVHFLFALITLLFFFFFFIFTLSAVRHMYTFVICFAGATTLNLGVLFQEISFKMIYIIF